MIGGLVVLSCMSVGLNLRLLYLIGKGVRVRKEIEITGRAQGGRKQLLAELEACDCDSSANCESKEKCRVRCDDENKILLDYKYE